MVDTPGRCRELDYCSIGQMRTLVRVPLGNPFVCPECGKPLREPVLINEPLSRKRLALWGVGTLGIFVLLYECAVPSAPKHHIQLAELQQQQARRAVPPAAAPAPTLVSPVKPQAAPVPAATAQSTSASAMPLVQGGSAPGVKVTMECSIDAAGVPSNCTLAPHRDLPLPAVSQQTPVSPPVASQSPLPQQQPQARPPSLPQPAVQQAAVPAVPPPAPPADREASLQPVAGGRPAYPTDYVRDGRAGEVSITCLIQASGEPQNCRVSDYIGGRRFAEAVVKWLNTGTVRFEPAMRDGHPVAEERHWHIAFPPR